MQTITEGDTKLETDKLHYFFQCQVMFQSRLELVQTRSFKLKIFFIDFFFNLSMPRAIAMH